jgi:hypothetical protein
MTAIEVSGEAVEAEFERWLRPRITKDDYPDDMEVDSPRVARVQRSEEEVWRKFVLYLEIQSSRTKDKSAKKVS